MRVSSCWLSLPIALACGCDAAPPAQSPSPPDRTPALSAPPAAPSAPAQSSTPTSSAEPVAPSASAHAPTPPYPEAAIERARREFSAQSCQKLVYKRGCAETRTGRVRVRFTLDREGKVSKLEIVKNEIKREPEVVAACLKKVLPLWKFDPPEAAEPSFELELIFGDKC